MPGFGTNEGNYLIEIEGFAAVRAMSVSGGAINHTPTIITEGNRPNPTVARGNYEIDEITIKQASALNDMGADFFDWIDGYLQGSAVEPRTLRLVTLDQDGQTPVETWEYYDCVPTSLAPDDRSARGQNGASFTIKLKPSDARLIL